MTTWDPSLATVAVGAGIALHGPADLGSVATLRAGLQWQPHESGNEFQVAGLRARAVGGRHARVHPVLPGPANLGWLIEDRVLVTGDEHPDPGVPVDVLVTPTTRPGCGPLT